MLTLCINYGYLSPLIPMDLSAHGTSSVHRMRCVLWREPNMVGANACYAARGTQDLTWEVPKSGDTRPRV